MGFEIGSVADWAQALTNTIVLLYIYRQLKLMNIQMIQNDDQERSRRSWEFVQFYHEQVKELDKLLPKQLSGVDLSSQEIEEPDLDVYIEHFYKPRIKLFTLLDQLLKHQEVEEKLLFGYLIEEFNNFVTLGVKVHGAKEFMSEASTKMSLLMTSWGAQVKARQLLIG